MSEGDLMRRSETRTDRRWAWWLEAFVGRTTLANDYVQANAQKVADIMTRNVVTATPDTPLGEIAALLERHHIKRVPIVRDGKVLGIVGLPMKKGRAGTMTRDYKRHGTTTLFAALDVLEGKVIGRCMQRHRHQEFIRFLNAMEAQVPVKKHVHVILDNYAAHKHPKVRQRLDRHPRFTFHFTPTSCSWLNAVEGFFAKLAKRRLNRGEFRCVVDLQAAINRFVAETNHDPKPFTWTADPDKIIAL